MPASTYDKVRLLAEGGFGVVHLVQRQKDAKISRQLKRQARVKLSIVSAQHATWMRVRKQVTKQLARSFVFVFDFDFVFVFVFFFSFLFFFFFFF